MMSSILTWNKGFMWPAVEPVDDCAIHKRRKFSSTHSELISNRTEAEHHMQVFLNLQNIIEQRTEKAR